MKNPNPLDVISPENLSYFDGDMSKVQPIIDLREGRNLLHARMQGFSMMGFGQDMMASIIYDAKDKTIQMRGRMRFHESENKMMFSDKNTVPYSEESLVKMKAEIDRLFELPIKKMQMVPLDEMVTLDFEIGEDIQSITKKFNDSGRVDISISSAPKT